MKGVNFWNSYRTLMMQEQISWASLYEAKN